VGSVVLGRARLGDEGMIRIRARLQACLRSRATLALAPIWRNGPECRTDTYGRAKTALDMGRHG